jgi:hypothetical protein
LIDLTYEYKNEIGLSGDGQPTEAQVELVRRRRDYFVPTMDRGQILRFEFLNAAMSEEQPAIWLDILHKGVVCKFQIARNQIFGVSQPQAALVGTLVGLLAVSFVILYVENLPLAALLSFLSGWLVVVPGVFIIKLYHKLRKLLAG